jgi:two-component system chemotaxis response regulator CheY
MAITLLVVDDSVIMLNLVRQALQEDGYTLLTGKNGAEGVALLQEHPEIGMVITDINMPVMDGIDFIKAIRARNTEVPVFALTSESDSLMREKGREAGANGWIVKPFQAGQFRDIVRQVLERFGLSG